MSLEVERMSMFAFPSEIAPRDFRINTVAASLPDCDEASACDPRLTFIPESIPQELFRCH